MIRQECLNSLAILWALYVFEKQHKNKYLPKALLLMQINMDKLLI